MRSFLFLLLTLLPAWGEPDSAQLVKEANALYQTKKYDEAIAIYTEALKTDPKNAETLMFRGLASSMKGDWQSCVKDLDSAISIAPKDLELLTTRAFARLHTGEFELAKKDFRAIDQIEEGMGRKAQNTMAEQLLQRARSNGLTENGDRKKALADYNRILAIIPPNDIILYERASVLIDLKDYEAALKDMDKVITIDGQIAALGDTHNTRAEVRRALGDEKGAIADEAEAKKRSTRLRSDEPAKTNEADKTERDNR